jgi:DNA (cytosine-5)-methyltransferase 1
MTVKSGVLFAGGGLTIEGLKAAGHRVAWGVEYAADIAGVLQDNNPDMTVYVKPVQDCDPRTMEPVDELHMSPVCTRFSQANVGGVESSLDIDAAKGCCEFIKVMLPKSIVLENVWGYRNSKSFAMILEVLHDKGYFVDFQHVCAADYGVPQTRNRMILRASFHPLPMLTPTHCDPARMPSQGGFCLLYHI